MRWIEAAISADAEGLEQLGEKLSALGIDGLVIEDEEDFRSFLRENKKYWDYVDEELENRFKGVSRVKFYLPDNDDGRKELQGITEAIGKEPLVTVVDDADWENCWKKYYRPLKIGEKLLIVPAWEECPAEGRTVLRLDPGVSFGTGEHATTRMCLCELEELVKPGMKVLDLGCGSGILSIASLSLGCRSAWGCDIDPLSRGAAERNAALNGLEGERFRALCGDVLRDESLRRLLGGGYDIVLANIVADVIIPLAGLVRGFMAEGGRFVCSGVIEGRQQEVMQALKENGLKVIKDRCEENWHCITAI